MVYNTSYRVISTSSHLLILAELLSGGTLAQDKVADLSPDQGKEQLPQLSLFSLLLTVVPESWASSGCGGGGGRIGEQSQQNYCHNRR